MSKYYCLAVNGLDEFMFGGPLSQLAGYLNGHTPNGVHFEVVGGVDPRPFVGQFTHNLAAAVSSGYTPIILGHSLGAMMMFYLADAMKAKNINLPLVISIDSTDWGTNAPGYVPYEVGTHTPGYYWVPNNVNRWIHYRQPVYPGGGIVALGTNNTFTKFENYARLEAHVVLPVLPDIEQHILSAVLDVVK